MIRVHVPVTSANIGVGYDCLGLALDYFGAFTFSFDKEGLVITGCPQAYQNKDNLVIQAFYSALDEWKIPYPLGITLDIQNASPMSRGLGSSASCIVAGVLGAAAFSKRSFTKQELLRVCLHLEHHPDNLAPALYGNLCSSFLENEQPYVSLYQVHEKFAFVTVIPDYEVQTAAARAILPDQMSYGDAVYQMGRCVALCRALETGDHELLSHACQDRMQEPYRKTLIKDYEDVRKIALDQGAQAFFISGSGSTMIAIIDQQKSEQLRSLFQKRYPSWMILNLQAAQKGGYVEYE